MQKPSDEKLVAYLDGELDESERAEIAFWLEQDEALRERSAGLSESARLLRTAFDSVLHEPLPERLIAAAHGPSRHAVVELGDARAKLMRRLFGDRRWWAGVAAAAGLFGLVVGGGFGYFAANGPGGGSGAQPADADLASNSFLDNIAGYHKLFVNAGADDTALVDVPANANADGSRKPVQKLPPDFRLPNLKPWGLDFQGARFLMIDGRRATALFYTTDNKALGPLTVVIGPTTKPDLAPTFDHRDDLNVLYWRHHGHAYTLVGTADIGYLWNISNDIAWQLDAI